MKKTYEKETLKFTNNLAKFDQTQGQEYFNNAMRSWKTLGSPDFKQAALA
jgi:hypothetical protein